MVDSITLRIIKSIFLFLLFLSVAAGCSKADNDNPPTVPVYLDTLTSGWSKTLSDISLGPITDIYFAESDIGYFIANAGVYKSTNSGITWARVYYGLFINIAAYSGNKAAFLRQDSIFVTSDAGLNFTNSSVGGSSNIYLSDIYYTTDLICYASGISQIFKSTNGGADFISVYDFPDFVTYSSLFFIDESTGWNQRGPNLFKTTDGGISWAIQKSFSGTLGIGSIYFIDAANGFFSIGKLLYKTTNGGTTWQEVIHPVSSDATLLDISMLSSNIIYLSGGNSIYKTTDAGTTWERVVRLGSGRIVEIHFTDASHGWACSSEGTILKFAQ